MKTGTTAIQNFIKSNKKYLNDNGFLYPEINVKAMNYLAFSLLDEIPPHIHHKLDKTAKDLYRELNKEISKSSHDKIIISTEAFYLISTDLFLGKEAPKRLYEMLKNNNYEFKIISYLRRQDEYLETQYNQHIKTHNFTNLYSKDINEFFKEKIELFQFNKILEGWEKVFGRENIIVEIYDKKKDVVKSFLKILDINFIENKKKQKDINPKLSEKGLEFMRIANKYGIVKSTENQNYPLINLIESNINSNKNYHLLNQEQCDKIMLKFKDENKILSEKYLSNNLDWFSENSNRPKNIIKESISVEECIKISTEIWNYCQSKMYKK